MNADPATGIRMVVFDVGETLVDESRGWLSQARAAGISAFTFSAMCRITD